MLLDKLTPEIYAYVKKHKRFRYFIKRLWQTYLSIKIKLIGVITGAKTQGPPSGIFNNLVIPQDREWHYLNDAISIKKLSDPLKITRLLPGSGTKNTHWTFRQKQTAVHPATFVITVDQGRVYQEGTVISPDNELIYEVSKFISAGEYSKNSSQHPILQQKKLYPLKKIEGSLAVLSAPSGRGYYHWMLDVLPRIELICQAGFKLEDIDKFLVNSYISRFHIETLNLLGIPRSKIIDNEHNPHLQADQLIVPSLVGNTGSVPLYACEFLRKRFLAPSGASGYASRRIYLNRGQVGHRRVLNEPEVIALLNQYGFESITLETLSLSEQIALMAGAHVVISPHGAGLTNIVFCKAGTTIIEFLYPASVNVMYWTICNELGLQYYYLMAEGEMPPEDVNLYLNSDDMMINTDKLEQTLILAGVLKE